MSSRKGAFKEDNGMRRKFEKLILACQGFIFEIFGMSLLKLFRHQLHYIRKKVDSRLFLTILIFLFAVPKLPTQLLHSLKFLRLLFVQRSYLEIFFKLWETIICDLLNPKFKIKTFQG